MWPANLETLSYLGCTEKVLTFIKINYLMEILVRPVLVKSIVSQFDEKGLATLVNGRFLLHYKTNFLYFLNNRIIRQKNLDLSYTCD